MNGFQLRKTRFWAWLSIWALLLSTLVPFDIAYAETIQAENTISTSSYEEKEPLEVQIVHEIVIFIRFSDESEDIYESRGGYDYIKSLYDGPTNSLKAYVDEYSWGKVQVNTHFLPQSTNGTPICYVDEHPASYYKKQSSSNPDGYTTANKTSRRKTLLQNALKFVGEDFAEKLGIEDDVYNVVFMVPDRGSWNDLLWSHKSTISINGVSKDYNMVTYPSKSDVSKSITHEFLHSLGFKDLYHLYDKTSPEPVNIWSIMGSTMALAGHPFVHEKDRYGNWIGSSNAIKIIRKSGHYKLGPSTVNPKENTIAYKIPVEGMENQFFMIEYRGSASSGSDADLNREGLIFYRVYTDKKGNGYGPPDEIYVLRNAGTTSVYTAFFDGTEGKTEFSNFQLMDDSKNLGISVYNIKIEDGYMSFDVSMPYEVMDGTSVLELKSNGTSPQKAGTTISFTATVAEEAISKESIYEYTVEKDGKKQELTMDSDFTASWTPKEAGVYTISYTVTDADGVISSKKMEYLIGTDTTAYILYSNSSWKQANIHYKIGTGTWTTLPGVQMLSSDISGYPWIYLMELGDKEKEAMVCFNNGNGSWDSKNEENYTVGVGVYGIKNNTITKLEESSVITPIIAATPMVTLSPTQMQTEAPAETKVPMETATQTPNIAPIETATQTPAITPTETVLQTPFVTPTETTTITPIPMETSTPKETEMPKVTINPTAIITPTPVIDGPIETPRTTEVASTPEFSITETPKATKSPVDKIEGMQVGMEIADNDTNAVYKITSIDKEKTVTYMKSKSNKTKVIIPDTVNLDGTVYMVTSISVNGFKNNKNLKTVIIGENILFIGSCAFQNCTALETVKSGKGLQRIGDKAFYGCKKLKEMSFSEKLTNIEKQAFYKCTSLGNITIPSKVKKIGAKAFYGCKRLKTIKIKTKKLTVKNVGNKAFKGIYEKGVIKVPKSKIRTYKKLLKTKGIVKNVKIRKM